ncbi:MAG: hypothetical protein ABW174_15530, partial [Flavitalea sp.]
MKPSLFLATLFTVFATSPYAQSNTDQLELKLNKGVFAPGDSLFVTARYNGSEISNQPLATLELIIENEDGARTRLRWPVLKGKASGAIFLPESLPLGKYTVLAGLQERSFEVTGQVKDAKNIGTLKAMLLTGSGEWDEQDVSVAPDGKFAINNWAFEDNAVIAFQGTRDKNQSINITIKSQLDSTFEPLAVAGRTFYIGNPPDAVRPTLNQPVETPETIFKDRGTVLPAVIVKGSGKTRAQQYSEKNVSGLFRSNNERVISILDDPLAISSPNIFTYLQGRVAGLQISGGFNGGDARWRGGPVTFFLDETRVSAQQIANIPMNDIAIVKAFPPPFMGAPGGGGGGGIAIYTRRGGESNFMPADRKVFKVRGYTPGAVALDFGKMRI